MKKLALVGLMLLVMVGIALGSEVIISEDFEGRQFPPEGWTAWNDLPWSYWEQRDKYGREECWAYGYSSNKHGATLDTPIIYSKSGQKIKVSFKHLYGNDPTVWAEVFFQGYHKVFSKNTWGWKEHSFIVTGPTRGKVRFYIWNGDWSIDDVRVVKCNEVGIDSTSIGKIKSLYK